MVEAWVLEGAGEEWRGRVRVGFVYVCVYYDSITNNLSSPMTRNEKEMALAIAMPNEPLK